MDKHFVSIIIVNYNGISDTLALIESLYLYNTYKSEIIVVDNGSKVDETYQINKIYPDVITIRSDKNLGFAGGNNLGIKHSKGDAIFFINNDTIVCMDGINLLIENLFSDPQIGGISPKIKFHFPPNNIQFAGYTELSQYTLRNKLIGFNCPDNEKYNALSETFYLHGAAMLIKRSVIDAIGGIPEYYFLYYEEIDWSLRMRNSGYKLIYNPNYTIFHKESQSTGQDSPLRTYYLVRNRLLFASKNRIGKNRWISILFQTSLSIPKDIMKSIIKGRFDISLSIIKGVKDFILLK